MKKFFLNIFLLSLTSCLNYDIDDIEPMFKAIETKYMKGDNIKWAEKSYKDNDWSKKELTLSGEEIFWIRKRVHINKKPKSLQTIGIEIQAFGAYEVYWDGQFIGTNGYPGLESKMPKKGTVIATFTIPNNLLDNGEHILAMRASQRFEPKAERGVYVVINNFEKLVKQPLLNIVFVHILAGAFLAGAIYYFLLYLTDIKKYPTLIFSVVSILFFSLVIIEYLKFYVPIHYSNFYLRLQIIGFLIFLIACLVPYFFSLQFSFKRNKKIMIGYAALLFAFFLYNFHHYDETALILGQTMWISSSAIIIYAIYKGHRAAKVILLGLVLSFVVYKTAIYDISLFASFGIILLCMFYILTIQLKQQKIAFEKSVAESIRLKYELLKKKIQPHFLMNTLTSLIDWVEESPKKGVQFIEALAEEFDLLIQVENYALIPLEQEIELCKSHIKIMGYRKEVSYLWEDNMSEFHEGFKIPPGVIHTLLENGITHCKSTDKNILRFKLFIALKRNKLTIEFFTIGTVRQVKNNGIDGTGNKYVKSRLRESYLDDWSFVSEVHPNGWKNKIVIPAKQ
ncbi:histidine kinase [uncultured Croceitalea sp.]|uniref:histidine kinase n=1 Tax=uncultured Croceitalea sp. TaxID=1798908 RepID=UPI003305C470